MLRKLGFSVLFGLFALLSTLALFAGSASAQAPQFTPVTFTTVGSLETTADIHELNFMMLVTSGMDVMPNTKVVFSASVVDKFEDKTDGSGVIQVALNTTTEAGNWGVWLDIGSDETVKYKVQAGDTLDSISAQAYSNDGSRNRFKEKNKAVVLEAGKEVELVFTPSQFPFNFSVKPGKLAKVALEGDREIVAGEPVTLVYQSYDAAGNKLAKDAVTNLIFSLKGRTPVTVTLAAGELKFEKVLTKAATYTIGIAGAVNLTDVFTVTHASASRLAILGGVEPYQVGFEDNVELQLRDRFDNFAEKAPIREVEYEIAQDGQTLRAAKEQGLLGATGSIKTGNFLTEKASSIDVKVCLNIVVCNSATFEISAGAIETLKFAGLENNQEVPLGELKVRLDALDKYGNVTGENYKLEVTGAGSSVVLETVKYGQVVSVPVVAEGELTLKATDKDGKFVELKLHVKKGAASAAPSVTPPTLPTTGGEPGEWKPNDILSIKVRIAQSADGELVIERGDTLWNIAMASGLSLDQLRSMNPDADDLDPGETLVLAV